MGDDTVNKRLSTRNDYSTSGEEPIQRIPVASMLANTKERGLDAKEKVYGQIVEYLRIKGYRICASRNQMVYAINSPILNDFLYTGPDGKIRSYGLRKRSSLQTMRQVVRGNLL